MHRVLGLARSLSECKVYNIAIPSIMGEMFGPRPSPVWSRVSSTATSKKWHFATNGLFSAVSPMSVVDGRFLVPLPILIDNLFVRPGIRLQFCLVIELERNDGSTLASLISVCLAILGTHLPVRPVRQQCFNPNPA